MQRSGRVRVSRTRLRPFGVDLGGIASQLPSNARGVHVVTGVGTQTFDLSGSSPALDAFGCCIAAKSPDGGREAEDTSDELASVAAQIREAVPLRRMVSAEPVPEAVPAPEKPTALANEKPPPLAS